MTTTGPESDQAFKAITIRSLVESTPMLNEDNYSLWRSKVEGLLKLRGILSILNSATQALPPAINDEISVYLISKLDQSTHVNIVTEENEGNTKLIWNTIKEYFASSQSANRARVSFEFLYVSFEDDLDTFITTIKSKIKRMGEVGITLPSDILSYWVLFKLPESLTPLRSQIMHSEAEISLDLVVSHLTQYKNESTLR